jgi:hypothetical protein
MYSDPMGPSFAVQAASFMQFHGQNRGFRIFEEGY